MSRALPSEAADSGADPRDRVVVVLDHPKDVVNIAGVIRVMKNFGLRRLRLVRPDEFDPYRIEGIAHRSADLVEAVTLHDSLQEAVLDATFVVGTTARARTEGRTYLRPRAAAGEVVPPSSACATTSPAAALGRR